jgi:mono/diheme cytochrome c family protein
MRKSLWAVFSPSGAAKAALILAMLALPAPAAGGNQQEKKNQAPAAAPAAEQKIPPEEARRENPLKGSAAAAAVGKRLYASQCAMCHGAEGDGKGDLADIMKLKLLDYRDPNALKNRTDGELFYILTKGRENMPGEEGRMKEEQRWQLITFIRSLAKKAEGEEKKPPS